MPLLPLFAPTSSTGINQKAFRLYEDGTESGSSAIAAQDANITRTVNSDSDILLRLMIERDGLASDTPPTTWQLQYSHNSGTWTNVTGSSSKVKGFNSTNLTDGGSTTNRLTGGSGSWTAGVISEDGLVDDCSVGGGNYTELLYALTLVAANVSNSDTLDFRVIRNGSTLDTYTVTPRVTVSKSGGGVGDGLKLGLLLLGVGGM